VAERTYLQAISDGLRQEMRRDKRVFVIGEDVGVYGGAFKVTLGFQEEFGTWRVIDAPLSETAIVGGCTGAALMGMRPVAEMQFADFVSCAWDHLVTVAAKQFYRAGTPVPMVVRLPSGGGFSGGPFHSQNPESSFAHIPGLKCVCPATPEDAKGLLATAIEDPNPVLYFEHKHLYRRLKAEVPEERYTIPFGEARTHREGEDISVITWGAMVHTADEAAEELAKEDVSVEVVDLRTVMPWDRKAVLASVEKTSKVLVLHEDTRTGGFGAEIAATIAEEAFEEIRRCRSRRRWRRRSSRRSRPSPPGCASWPRTDGHRHDHRRRHAADGRLRLGGDDRQVAEVRGRDDRGRRGSARDLDRQGRYRGAEPRHRRGREDPRPRGRDGRRRHEARRDRTGGCGARCGGARAGGRARAGG
jgi:2-oxoisovalerate dehydrogenase E1 component beta subunit